jgi:hypothetical protein
MVVVAKAEPRSAEARPAAANDDSAPNGTGGTG